MLDKILITGGSGLLGKHLTKYFPYAEVPPHYEFDVTKPIVNAGECDTVIHLAGFTNVTRAEIDKKACFDLNVTGTKNLREAYPDARFIYISSEYVKNPVNYYSFTKLWGESVVKEMDNYLIIRTLFKDNPFPYMEAFVDQYTTGDYVDVIAPLIAKAIIEGRSGTIDIGTGRKTMFELARRTQPDIKGISVDDVKDVMLPRDYR